MDASLPIQIQASDKKAAEFSGHKAPAESKIRISIESIQEFFQSCKNHFCHDINKESEKQNHSKNKVKFQECQHPKNKKEDQLLSWIRKTLSKQNDQFHFDEQQREIVFEEALILSFQMIQKNQSTPSYKKSRQIKRFLTKFLLLLNRFLVEKILNQTKMRSSQTLIKASWIFSQGAQIQVGKQSRPEKTKRQGKTHFEFQVPLPMTNIKMPFSIFFYFSLLQEEMFNAAKSKNSQKMMHKILSQINTFCEYILLDQQRYDTAVLLVKTVCQTLGCLQLPVTYLFFSSIVKNIEKQFTCKYPLLNKQDLLIGRYNRQIFSMRNLGLIVETFSRNSESGFTKIQLWLTQNGVKNVNGDQRLCFMCNIATDKTIQAKLIQIHQFKQKQVCFSFCAECFCQANKLEKKQTGLLDKAYFQEQLNDMLLVLFNRIFWRQQFELLEINKIKSINSALLQFCGKVFSHSYDLQVQCLQDQKKDLGSNQIFQRCLKTLFGNDFENKRSKKQKIMSLPLLECQISSILLILLNSKSEILREQVLDIVSRDSYLQHFSLHLSSNDIQQIYLEGEILSQPILKQAGSKILVRKKLSQLLLQVKKRLLDSSTNIQVQSLKFFFKLSKCFESPSLMIEIFNLITALIIQRAFSKTLSSNFIAIIRLLHGQIQDLCRSNRQRKQADIITAKHVISRTLVMIFNCFSAQSGQNVQVLQVHQTRQTVKVSFSLIQALSNLINEQLILTKIYPQNSQYESLVISYLKEFEFTKQTIRCFNLNDTILQKLILLTDPKDSENPSQIQANIQKTCLLKNLKLILEQVFDFNKFVQKQIMSKKKQKKGAKNSKGSKLGDQNVNNENTQNSSINFQSQSSSQNLISKNACCNLNRIIKNIISKKQCLTHLNCEILALLIQKNILLNYESQANVSDTPTKIKRLILSLEAIKRFHEILTFLQNQIKECNIEFLEAYVKLYVVICLQINEQSKIQTLFVLYLNGFKYFKKAWLHQYEKFIYCQSEDQGLSQGRQKTNDFFSRTLKTIAFFATELEKFKKIQDISGNYLSGFKNITKNEGKYSIFSQTTQDAINSLQTSPEKCFVQLYQQIYLILDLLTENQIFKEHIQIVNRCLQILGYMLNIHPHLLVRIVQLLECIPRRMTMNLDSYYKYMRIFSCIINTKDSILLSVLTKTYFRINESLFQTKENQSKEAFEVFQKFYQITYEFLKQDVISIHEAIPIVYYGLFTKNNKINQWTADYIQHLKQKGTDSILLNDFQNTIIVVSEKLRTNNEYFYQDPETFRNIAVLAAINKETVRKPKTLLQRDIKQIKIRSTFIKKISQIFTGDFDWLRYTNENYDRAVFFLLKAIQSYEQMDIYELQQLLAGMQKVIRQYYLQILRINDQYRPQEDKDGIQIDQIEQKQDSNIHLMGQKRRTLFMVGQFMFTLIKLTNEKKLKIVNKQIERHIEAKKFTSASINIATNQPKDQSDSHQNKKDHSIILNYESCLNFIKQLDKIVVKMEINSYDEMKRIMLNLTKDFKTIAKKMHSVIFQNQKPRQVKNIVNSIKKVQKKKRKNTNDDDQEYSQITENSQNQFADLSRGSSLNKSEKSSKVNQTQRINSRSNPSSSQNSKPTKKDLFSERKLMSSSLPKKLNRNLSVIHEANNDQDQTTWLQEGGQNTMTRRSKRLIERKKTEF